MEPHQHEWKLAVHIDGCHFFSSTYTCHCGAQSEDYSERDPDADSYAAMWMDPECARCNELIGGAEPKRRSETTKA